MADNDKYKCCADLEVDVAKLQNAIPQIASQVTAGIGTIENYYLDV